MDNYERERAERIHKLQQLGYRVLRDDEVQIQQLRHSTAAVAVWNNPEPGCRVNLRDPREIAEYERHADDPHTVTHDKYPLVINAALHVRIPELGEDYYEWWHTADYGAQAVHRCEQSETDPRRVRALRYSDRVGLPKDFEIISAGRFCRALRATAAKILAARLQERGTIPFSRRQAVHDLFGSSVVRSPFLRVGYVYNTPFYSRQRKTLRDLGELVARHCAGDEEADADEVVDLINDIMDERLRSRAANRVVDEWNDAATGGSDDIGFGACGHAFTCGSEHDTNDGEVCVSCFEDDYVYVEDTDEYHRESDVYEHSNGNYYTYEEEDPWDDDDDDGEEYSPHVTNYTANVLRSCPADTSIHTSPYGEFLMGLELEVMPLQGERRDAAQHTFDYFEDYAILKSDSSLGGRGKYAEGIEIVTAPRGLKEHIRRFKNWEPHSGLRAWDPGNCGLHVHISSQAFTQATLGKLIEFINCKENDQLIKDIAGRHPTTSSAAADYCQREGEVYTGNPKKNLAGKSTSRYRMINTTNLSEAEAHRLGLQYVGERQFNTVELRIFRATLSKPRLLAQIEFAHAAVMFCRWSSMRELQRPHFIKWLRASAGLYPHLAKWFGVKANTEDVVADPPIRQTEEV